MLVQSAKQVNRIDPTGILGDLFFDLCFPLPIPRSEFGTPRCPRLAIGLLRESRQKPPRIGQDCPAGAPIQAQIALTPIHRDEFRATPNLPTVVEAKVAWNTRQEDEVRLPERQAPFVSTV